MNACLKQPKIGLCRLELSIQQEYTLDALCVRYARAKHRGEGKLCIYLNEYALAKYNMPVERI